MLIIFDKEDSPPTFRYATYKFRNSIIILWLNMMTMLKELITAFKDEPTHKRPPNVTALL